MSGARRARARRERLVYKVVLAPDAISGLYDRGAHELAAIGVHLMNASDVLSVLTSNDLRSSPDGIYSKHG